MAGLLGGVFDFLFGKPDVPDYTGAAQAQGTANKETAIAQSMLNNPNMYTPYGTQVYTGGEGGTRPTLTQTLSPAEQLKLDRANAIQNQTLGILGEDMPQIREALLRPFGMEGGAAQGYMAGSAPGRAQTDANFGSAGPIQNRLDFSGLPGIPVASPQVRDMVAQNLYQQGARFLDPQFQQAQQGLDSMLANQGIARNPGQDTAWQQEQDNLARQRMSAYGDLMDRSVIGGGDAMQQLFGMQMGARQQGVGEIGAQGQFANAAQQQAFQDIMNSMQARNQGIGLQGQLAGQEANLYNQGRQQNYTEMMQNRTMPINTLNALLTGSQVNNPQFQPTNPTQITPPPIMQGAQLEGAANTAAWNAPMAFLGNMAQAGATAFGKSDRRLKSNIVPLGKYGGHEWYRYTIEGREEVGVMADEVEKIRPEAVITGPDGYKMVNYAGL